MNYGARRPGVPTYIVAILATCGGCLLVSIVSVALLVNAAINTAPALLGRASVLQAQKRYREAEALLLTAVRKSPNDADVLNNLAWTYYLDGKFSEGEPYAVRAIAINSSPSNIDTIAHIHLGLKRYDAAEKEFNKALGLNPNIAESRDGLGQVYEHRGKFDKALVEYRKAVAANPSIDGTQARIDRLVLAGHGGKGGN